ncbi:MAG: hypothetical protein AB7E41_00795 [Mycolicibacterium sp.]|uniref:hypothetical protein n=1 Tax=Mycolicibacterium sp. TaxID=2320850 RepID=UPI00355D081E
MREVLGRAAVMFAGPRGEALFDAVAILPGGVLRTAQLVGWQSEFGWCEAEVSVRYHPAGSWVSVSPCELSGTLFVVDCDPAVPPGGDRGQLCTTRRLGDRLPEAQARARAVAELCDTYRLSPVEAEARVREHFGAATEFTVPTCDAEDQSADSGWVVRFVFACPPAGSVTGTAAKDA